MDANNVTNTTQSWQMPGTCHCGQLGALRTAVAVLAVMLGTLVASIIVFVLLKSKRWKQPGEAPKQAEMDELKKQNEEDEEEWKDFNWDKFSTGGSERDPRMFPDREFSLTIDKWVEMMRRNGFEVYQRPSA